MANHIRQQIRERVASDLTGLTTTGSNVFQSRVYPLSAGELPGLLIYTNSEESEPIEQGADRLLERTLRLSIEGYVEAIANSDDTIDTICKEVETALASDRTLNSLAKDCYLTSTDTSFEGTGDKPVGFVQMIFTIDYFTLEQSPDTAR
tara:strand:+ start:46 stop:492 length:447 start_codon:yes stop_codon:yes gene_type:complete